MVDRVGRRRHLLHEDTESGPIAPKSGSDGLSAEVGRGLRDPSRRDARQWYKGGA